MGCSVLLAGSKAVPFSFIAEYQIGFVGQGTPNRPSRGKSRVCALDLGEVRVGVAISDDLRSMAHPRGVLARRPQTAFLNALGDLVKEENITHILVGLPLDMRGTEGEAARRVRHVAQAIADATGSDVELCDERLTTVEAARALAASEVRGEKARARVDEAAAVAILQAWLDARAKKKSRPK